MISNVHMCGGVCIVCGGVCIVCGGVCIVCGGVCIVKLHTSKCSAIVRHNHIWKSMS